MAENSLVLEFGEKPVIRLYISTGLYMFEPKVYDLIPKRVDMGSEKAVEFENAILPELTKQRKVYAMVIPKGVWCPVNTLKELEKAEQMFRVLHRESLD
ncbi:MAG: hypothetical protein DRJ51_05510 [Thermoprotei archaeon]|nr:MAG: hypothetical protein DRJ51_05510 [Thermoprotei archaeon]